MKRLDLNGKWMLKEKESRDWVSVTVPGSVLSGFLDAGRIPDPFYRDNEYDTRELFWKDYEFERTFDITEELLLKERLDLVCEGLDTLADLYLNGKLAASADNMHRAWRFPVKEFLKAGENHIRIVFRSVLRYIEDHVCEEKKEIHYIPCSCMKGNQYLRKAHSMFGWDWGPQLIDAGIFRSIYLEAWEGARLQEVHIRQVHEDGMVRLPVEILLEKTGVRRMKDWSVSAEVRRENGPVCGRWECSAEELENGSQELLVKNPRLWWPAGYGEQPLYQVTVTLKDEAGKTADEVKKTIGLRTLTVSCEKDPWGNEFAFQINGKKIFARGGNYIPEDCVYSRITPELQEYLLKSCVRANFNCIRVWGGGYYPSDEFYDLCDRYGLIVWQDLMFACNVYDVTEEFAENCRQEVLDNVKRLRHHPSLGLWCGNNEIESAWDHWADFQKETMYLRMDYVKLFEYILPKAVKEADPDTFYWASSPSSGGCFDRPDDENRGDAHYWDVWHGQKPFTDYQKYFFRFCSEFGFQSFPCQKTVDSFTAEEDRNIFSRVMESHQKNDAANGKILYYLSENFRYPKDFTSLLYISQVLQGIAMKYGVEHWRRNRGRCMGTLYWQVNDNWPVASWSGIDYFGRWKALHYMARKFYAPIAASIQKTENGGQEPENGARMAVWLTNETEQSKRCRAELKVKDMRLRTLRCMEREAQAKGEASTELAGESVENLLRGLKKEEVFLEASVTLEDGTALKECETFVPYKHLNLPKGTLQAEVSEKEDRYEIAITGKVFTPFVELDFADADVIFSDNFFTVSGEEAVRIILFKSDIYRGGFAGAEDLKARLQIRTLADSFR